MRRRLPLLLLLATAVPACTTWAEIHGPTFGVALEVDHDWNFSPRLQVGYEYDRWSGILVAYGGGGGIAVSLLEPRFEIYGEVRGQGLAAIPSMALGTVLAYTPDDGWAGGLRAGFGFWPGILFWPPEYCSMGWWEQTREDPCPVTEYAADDVVYPTWLPRIEYRFSAYWPFDGGASHLVHQLGFSATVAWWQLAGMPPGPVITRPDLTID
jgi:hypothetical protein